jgi:type II secretory pathway component PulJ
LRHNEDGITLVELMVSMTVMAVFLAMFTGAMIEIYRSQDKNEASSAAMAQVNNAFLKLDKEIRYASAISAQGTVSADQYIEFLSTCAAIDPGKTGLCAQVTGTGAAICTELRYDPAQQLVQQRNWTQTVESPDARGWTMLATNVTATQPFTYVAPDQTYGFQRVKVDLTATWGTNLTATSRTTTITMTALNTTPSTSSGTVCTEGRTVA